MVLVLTCKLGRDYTSQAQDGEHALVRLEHTSSSLQPSLIHVQQSYIYKVFISLSPIPL